MLFQIDLALETDDAFAIFAGQDALDHAGHRAHTHDRAEASFTAGLDEANPERRLRTLDDEEFQRAAVRGLREDARRDHACIVQHGEVARPQVAGKIRERAVLDAPLRAMKDHHARGGTFGRRMTRDEAFGQRVIVIARQQHGAHSHQNKQERPSPLVWQGAHAQSGLSRSMPFSVLLPSGQPFCTAAFG